MTVPAAVAHAALLLADNWDRIAPLVQAHLDRGDPLSALRALGDGISPPPALHPACHPACLSCGRTDGRHFDHCPDDEPPQEAP